MEPHRKKVPGLVFQDPTGRPIDGGRLGQGLGDLNGPAVEAQINSCEIVDVGSDIFGLENGWMTAHLAQWIGHLLG